jgi:peptide/nickel transport system ATP-binding protein
VVRELGTTAVYVSHDLAVVAQMADRIVVLKHGEIMENGRCAQMLAHADHPYTRSLLAAAEPAVRQLPPVADAPPLLKIEGLVAGYGGTRILNDVSLTIARGASVGVIGESGSGKTTLARVVAGMIAPTSGSVLLDGEALTGTNRTREQFRRVQFVFQNADTALNPAHTIGRILARPLAFYHGMDAAGQKRRVAELLDLVRLPAAIAARKPRELSGGQKQRINLARALAAEPDLILCDEITSALDTVVAAAILDLMAELRRELHVSTMFISHDIGTVRAICDDIVVLYAGNKVEARPRSALLQAPFHPYTHLLMSSVPQLRQHWLEETPARNAAGPVPAAGGKLCTFLDRCSARIDGVCTVSPPPRRMLGSGSDILCHHSESSLRDVQLPLLHSEKVA